jgi:hypothetical protein
VYSTYIQWLQKLRNRMTDLFKECTTVCTVLS